jgi:hypothetical protein
MLNSSEDSHEPSNEIRVSSADAVKLSELAKSEVSSQQSPETPKAKSKRSSVRFTSHSSPQLKSRKNHLLSLRSKDEVEKLNKQTSEQVIKSVYHLIKSKFPLNYGNKELSSKDQDEIQAFFLKKKSEFSRTLEEIYSKQQTQPKLSRKSLKLDEKISKNLEKEIFIIKQRKKLLKKEIIQKASEKILKAKQIALKKKKIEARKKELEERKIQEKEKEIIIKNIENFYKDRLSIFKEALLKREESQKILNYEEKLFASSVFKEIKQKKLSDLLSLKNKYEQDLEELKEKLNTLSH